MVAVEMVAVEMVAVEMVAVETVAVAVAVVVAAIVSSATATELLGPIRSPRISQVERLSASRMNSRAVAELLPGSKCPGIDR